MSEEERKCIYMTSVLTVNQLWDNQHAKEELNRIDLADGRLTPNTHAAYPLSHIDN